MDDPVEVRDAGHKGKGLLARRDFKQGDIILQWEQGRIVHHDEIATLTPWEQDHLSELSPDTDQVLPAPRCFANHACRANAISTSTTLHAWRDIQASEEITIDYRLNAHDRWEMLCSCAAYDRPHVVVGDFFTLPDELERQYLPYAPAFVQEEYRRRHAPL